jgi:hypothetical protein
VFASWWRRSVDAIAEGLRFLKIEKVKYQDKPLLLIRVAESTGIIHNVKDFGLFIRSNGSELSSDEQGNRALIYNVSDRRTPLSYQLITSGTLLVGCAHRHSG